MKISRKFPSREDYFLKSEELTYIRETLDIFKIFTKPSAILQGEKYPTLSLAYPYIYQIRRKLKAKRDNPNLVS